MEEGASQVDYPGAAVLKVWVATQTWVAKGQKMGRAKVIQICQKKIFSFQF